jgi:DNA polymerase elongation subunit (family B)
MKQKTLEEFLNLSEPTTSDYKFDLEIQQVNDTRSRAWFAIPLSGLVTPLLNKRKNIKAEMKLCNYKSDEYNQLNAFQESLKLIINTIFGVLTSPFFDIGNTVLANNITCRARVFSFTMSRVFHGFQTITDGCQYQASYIYKFRQNSRFKPGVATLSSYSTMDLSRDLEKTSLGMFNWEEIFRKKELIDELKHQLDSMAEIDYNSFWSNYKVENDYKLEHNYNLENSS